MRMCVVDAVAGKPELAREAKDAVRARKHCDLQVAVCFSAVNDYVLRLLCSFMHVGPSCAVSAEPAI